MDETVGGAAETENGENPERNSENKGLRIKI